MFSVLFKRISIYIELRNIVIFISINVMANLHIPFIEKCMKRQRQAQGAYFLCVMQTFLLHFLYSLEIYYKMYIKKHY